MIKGSLHTKSGGKNYYAVISGYDGNGKRQQKWINTDVSVKGNNKRKAEARLAEILAEYGEGGITVAKDVYFADFMVQWLETLKIHIAPTTYDGYKYILNSHILPFFNQRRLKVKDVTPAVIQKYVNTKLGEGLKPNSVQRHLANLSKCLDSAVKQNIIAFNPVKRIEKPKKEKFTGAKRYNDQQIEQLLECFKDDPLEIVILLTLFYGLRRSDENVKPKIKKFQKKFAASDSMQKMNYRILSLRKTRFLFFCRILSDYAIGKHWASCGKPLILRRKPYPFGTPEYIHYLHQQKPIIRHL